MRNLYIGIIVIIFLAIGVFIYVQNSGGYKNSEPKSSSATSNTSEKSSNQTSEEAKDSVMVTYSSSGFDPETVTVKTSGQLTITNDSSSELQFNSNPHPIHTVNSELNIGTISAGESKSVTLNKTGTFGYHNHLNSSQTGTIVVK